jgi:benzylsuccinate CoA-transferase BbsF subunit
MNELPLSGIRIIDFSWIIAGPTAARHLALMGAEVIKVGSSRRPDPSTKGSPYQVYNQSKEYCALNLSNKDSKNIAIDLISTADVVIENFAAGVFDRMGFDYETLREYRPDIILLSSAGTGHTGPDKNFVAYGSLLQHYTGWNTISGYGDGNPIKGGLWADPWVGMELSMILMAAINHRMESGKGQYIDYSMAESLTASISSSILDYQISGKLSEPNGNKSLNKYPHGLYKCLGTDKWVSISIDNNIQWNEFCELINQVKWVNNSDFNTVEKRKLYELEIDKVINDWTKLQEDYDVMHILQAIGIEAAPSLDISRVYSDPSLYESGFLSNHVFADGTEKMLPTLPWNFTNISDFELSAAPNIGDSNEKIYLDLLGIDIKIYKDLIEKKVIY